MKKIFLKLWRSFLNLFKSEKQKQDDNADAIYKAIYTEMAKKSISQKELINKIIKNFEKDTGHRYGFSRFIPFKEKSRNTQLVSIVNNIYGKEMQELGVVMNANLSFTCIR